MGIFLALRVNRKTTPEDTIRGGRERAGWVGAACYSGLNGYMSVEKYYSLTINHNFFSFFGNVVCCLLLLLLLLLLFLLLFLLLLLLLLLTFILRKNNLFSFKKREPICVFNLLWNKRQQQWKVQKSLKIPEVIFFREAFLDTFCVDDTFLFFYPLYSLIPFHSNTAQQ